MIDRILLAKLTEPETREERAAALRAALEGVSRLRAVTVGVPADAAARRSWDVSIVLSCERAADLEAVLDAASVRATLSALEAESECVKGWSFERP